jgi:hypothetical protein
MISCCAVGAALFLLWSHFSNKREVGVRECVILGAVWAGMSVLELKQPLVKRRRMFWDV